MFGDRPRIMMNLSLLRIIMYMIDGHFMIHMRFYHSTLPSGVLAQFCVKVVDGRVPPLDDSPVEPLL